jgi:hypothetical protein
MSDRCAIATGSAGLIGSLVADALRLRVLADLRARVCPRSVSSYAASK